MSDLNKLIDNGHCVAIFRNELGSITAFALHPELREEGVERADDVGWLTDHFSVEESIKQLSDKITGVGIYSRDESDESGGAS